MPYPNIYDVTYSYGDFQQSQGNNAFPGTQLDADLAGLEDSIDNVSAFMQNVIRSDGALKNGVVTYDSLSTALQTAGLAPADAWVTAHVYPVNSNVVTNSSLYRCLVAHTSGVFATDLAAGKWVFVTALQPGSQGIQGTQGIQGDQGVVGPAAWLPPVAWLTATAYVAGPPASAVTQGGETYVCLVPHSSGVFATDLAAAKWVKAAQKGVDGVGYGGTSSTSLAIANTTTKVFTTQAGLGYNGARVRAASAAAPLNFMEGVCTYSGTTLTMTVDTIGGSGTKTDWVFSIAGQTNTIPIRGYISGLTTSNNAVTPNTKIDVAAGVATDDTNSVLISLASGTIDLTATGTNGLDAGTLANSTWYHMFAIAKTDGTVARLASTSVSAPTLPSGYTLKRRIGSFKTNGSAQVIAYLQFGFDFLWSVPVNDHSANYVTNDTTAKTPTLSVPTGVSVRARIWFYLQSGESVRRTVLITSPNQPDTAASAGSMCSIAAASSLNAGVTQAEFDVWTNTSGQIRYRADGGSANGPSVFINTAGWFDPL